MKRSFTTLHIIAIILNLLAVFFVGVGLVMIIFLLEIMHGHLADLAVLPWSIGLSLSLLWGVDFLLLFTGLLLAAWGGMLKLLLAIENNTGLTLLQLMRIHQWNQD